MPLLILILSGAICSVLAPAACASGQMDSSPGRPADPPHWDALRRVWEEWKQEPWADSLSLDAAGSRAALERRLLDGILDILALGPAQPPDSSDRTWSLEVVREALITGDPAARRLLKEFWDPPVIRGWDPDGALTLPAALNLAAEGLWGECLAWLESCVLPEDETPFGSVLQVEALLAMEDTLGAGRRARELLASLPAHPPWVRSELEQAWILSLLAREDTAAVRTALEEFSAQSEDRGFWLVQRAALSTMRGDSAMADSLTWVVVREFPGGRTTGRVLREFVDASKGVKPELGKDRLRLLLDAAERRVDLDRFLQLSRALGKTAGPSARDSLAIREAALNYRARAHDRLVEMAWSRPWSPEGFGAGEWGLIHGRAHRNRSLADSMGAWYGRVLAAGKPGERVAAAWEWAREADYLREFGLADSLYGLYLDLGGTGNRIEALLFRGLCRLIPGELRAARESFQVLALGSDAEGAAAGWFWTYRVDLAGGDIQAARRSLEKAAGFEWGGYYAWRARSALWVEAGGGPGIEDPAAYWETLPRPATVPGLDSARISSAEKSIPSLEPAAKRIRDRLLLFRTTGRARWARQAQDDLAALAGRIDLEGRLRAYLSLGLPDLAARSAVRSGSRRLDWIYPTPYAGIVGQASRTRGIAPEWIWSIMRRESFFENAVVSGAGATGLMQLMDGTARQTAGKHRLEESPLSNAWVNVRLGTAHLADLWEDGAGTWPEVLAAYNAGLSNAVRWRHPEDDPDLYIERIGYAETRTYVKKVVEGYWIYRRLLRGSP